MYQQVNNNSIDHILEAIQQCALMFYVAFNFTILYICTKFYGMTLVQRIIFIEIAHLQSVVIDESNSQPLEVD